MGHRNPYIEEDNTMAKGKNKERSTQKQKQFICWNIHNAFAKRGVARHVFDTSLVKQTQISLNLQ